ncbi:hypothetical protein BDZ97DRAFT_1808980 [Flammula alnicola]|nr:hypothetical protein BDZ97DRAFT_1808980 [Flammula alnicola]
MRRWTPPEDMPPLRSNSPDEGSSGSPTAAQEKEEQRYAMHDSDREAELDDMEENEAEVRPVPVPQIMRPPPRSPLRTKTSKPSMGSKQMDKAGLFSWARNAASPVPSAPGLPRSPSAMSVLSASSVQRRRQRQQQLHGRTSFADSTRASIGDASLRDEITISATITITPTIISATSTTITVRGGRSSSGGYGSGGNGNMYGTIRTITTDLTSEAPSMSRTEGSMVAEEVKRKRSGVDMGMGMGMGASGGFGRGQREGDRAPVLDLSRVAEETDESVSSKGHTAKESNREGRRIRSSQEQQQSNQQYPNQSQQHLQQQQADKSEKQQQQPAVYLRKGIWPDDFNDAFQPQGRSQVHLSPLKGLHRTTRTTAAATQRQRQWGRGRPLAAVDAARHRRRAAERRRRAGSTPRCAARGPPAARGQPGQFGVCLCVGSYVPRSNGGSGGSGNDNASSPESDGGGGGDAVAAAPVPFPRSVSASAGENGGTPSPRSERPRLGSSSAAARRRARPNSYDELGATPRSRFESMVNLGGPSGATSASDLLSRDSMDGRAVRMRLVVREDGKPPTHFQLGNCIGRGQFGSVYRALNLNTGQMVAVKRIRLEGLKEEEVTTLMREVDLVKSLSHPSIVKYEGMARDDDTLSIVLEYAENGSLGQTLKAFGKLNERLVASYVVKILEGLHYLHTSDVVHCDLKAANILTTKNGNVKLSDFGVSLNLRAMEREIKDVAGTPNWMAPEVIELKGASTKSDIWSLGCTVVELLTGRPPYAEILNSMSVMFRIVEDDMPPLPEGSSELLKDFLEQCFHKDPTRRPSAELLCEHPWLKKNWVALKELRPQDSIPFLRRVSTDLHKSDAVRYLSQLDVSDSPISASPKRDDVGKISPIGRRTSAASVRPLDNEFSPREHTFVKTTFSKPMVCRVCQLSVKKTAVLCSQCSLISHAKCAVNAPPTCDLRAQLLLYAQYAQNGNPASAYSNPADIINDIAQNVAMSDIPFVEHNTPGTSMDSPQPPRSPSQANNAEHPPTAFKFMAAFRRSRTNLSPEPVAITPSSSSTPPSKDPDEIPKRQERPLSVTSDSTGLSSLRSAATAAESFSSRQNTGQRSQVSGGDADKAKRHLSEGTALDRARSSKITSSARSEATNEHERDDLPGSLPTDTRKQTKKHNPNRHPPAIVHFSRY